MLAELQFGSQLQHLRYLQPTAFNGESVHCHGLIIGALPFLWRWGLGGGGGGANETDARIMVEG